MKKPYNFNLNDETGEAEATLLVRDGYILEYDRVTEDDTLRRWYVDDVPMDSGIFSISEFNNDTIGRGITILGNWERMSEDVQGTLSS